MRRPARTKKQKQHDKEQRLLLLLRKKAAKWSVMSSKDTDGSDDADYLINALTDLQTAADKYTEALSPRELRKLLK